MKILKKSHNEEYSVAMCICIYLYIHIRAGVQTHLSYILELRN